jgi:hypothetical protein
MLQTKAALVRAPIRHVAYSWLIYRNDRPPYTGTVLAGESLVSERAAAVRVRKLARENPGQWFGYGFCCERTEQETAVVEYCWSAGGFEVIARSGTAAPHESWLGR